MSHPMDGYNDGERAESDRRWKRIHALREKLTAIPMSALNAADAFHVSVVMEPAILEKAFDKEKKIDAALDRLEAVVASRTKPEKKPLRARRGKR